MLRKIILLIILALSSQAKIETIKANPDILSKYTQIIDLRTPREWHEKGIIPNSITMEFVGNRQNFVKDVFKNIDCSKPLALICKKGSRSRFVAKLLDEDGFCGKDGMQIIVLDGGMESLISQGYKPVPYDDKK